MKYLRKQFSGTFIVALSVGAVERQLRKYRDGCNRSLPLWAQDIKEHTTTQLKLPSMRKCHIFKWLLPHCKNWLDHLKDYDFYVYFPKLADLETHNVKCKKIKAVEPTFVKTTLPDKVVDILCEVYCKVVFVTCVQLYMYEAHTLEFQSDYFDTILGFV